MPITELDPKAPLDPPRVSELPAHVELDKPAQGPEKIYYNEANQPFTLSGKPIQPAPEATYTGSILPLSRDEKGLHSAVPEAIAGPLRGVITGGKRALGVGERGQNPLRPLSQDELSAAMALSPASAGVSRSATVAAPLARSGISTERAQLAREAIDTFGIPLTAGQVGASPTAKLAESAIRNLPLSGTREHELEVRQSFNQAVAKTFGEDAKTITQTVMERAKKRIGGEINRIENSAEIDLSNPNVSNPFLTALANIEVVAKAGLTDQEFAVVKRLLDNTIDAVSPSNRISGTTYGNLLHRNSPLDRAAGNANANIARPAQQIKTALQDALQASLSGSDLDDYRFARFQYKNMKTVEPLVNKAPTGDISPTLLNARVSYQFPNRAFDTSGTNPLDRLAKIGQAFMKEPPTSGTAERGYTLAKLGELGAALAAGDIFGVPATLAGVGGTLAAGRGIGSYLRSPGLTNRTIERALHPVPPWSGEAGAEALYRAIPGGVLSDQNDTMRRAASALPP